MHLQPTRLTLSLAAAGLLCGLFAAGPAHALTIEELAKKLEAVEAQNAALKAKVEKLEAAQGQQAQQVQQQAQAVEKVQQAAAAATATSNAASWAANTTVSSYGEIGYSRPSKASDKANVDVGRAVIGISHRFDDKTKMVSEFEVEHTIVSKSDAGEFEVEQLYVEREFANGLRGKAGLFLMPVGLINLNHEPTAYLGVFRPDVDTKIVPSTWREVGIGLSGDTAFGATWDVGMTTGPNLSKWDPASDEGRVRGPLAATHGEGQFASARDPLVHAAVNWRGIPGLHVGGSVVAGKLGQGQPGFLGNKSTLLMLDLHARYEINGWDFAGEFIRARISNTEALNGSYSASSTVNPTLVPALFYGGYVQAAYKWRLGGDYTLIPFTRYEVLNTAAGYGSLSAAAGGVARPDEKIWTVGASLRIGEGVVLKADYRSYKNDKLPSEIPPGFTKGNSLNLGVGYSF
ncbi:MAG: hypothetical protein KGK18_09865 [Burkholderiales bacterium]|nr:hypothetical protein [Burkholderiales bacterium]